MPKKITLADAGKLRTLIMEIISRLDGLGYSVANADILLSEAFTEVEEEKWTPQVGDSVWFVKENGWVARNTRLEYDREDYYKELAAVGNCFRTEKEAEAHKQFLLDCLAKKYKPENLCRKPAGQDICREITCTAHSYNRFSPS